MLRYSRKTILDGVPMKQCKYERVEFTAIALPLFMLPALAWGIEVAAPSAAVAAAPAIRSVPVVPADQAASYSLGLTFGGQLHHGGLKDAVSMDALLKGINDGLNGRTVTQEDKQRVAVLLRTAKDAIGAKNKTAAREFLVKNAKAAGVTTTASGLQYKILAPGDAASASPRPTDQVTVQYRGRLLNGTEFDSSYSHGQAASFRVSSVIKGWKEALPLMKPGAKWQLFVPPELAYDLNSPATIPPGSLLVFDIELVKINAPASLSDPAMRQLLKPAPADGATPAPAGPKS
jgi:FKBP-type peptidyl-prolyl cis-trans isomerase FklB